MREERDLIRTKIGGLDLRVGQQHRSFAGRYDPASLHHVSPIGNFKRCTGVLLNQQHGDAIRL